MNAVRAAAKAVVRPGLKIPGGNAFGTLLRQWLLASTRRCSISVRGTGNHVDIPDGCRFSQCRIRIRGNSNTLKIGPGCSLWRTTIDLISNHSTIQIGARTSNVGNHLGFTHMVAKGDGCSIRIGQGCLLSYGIEIRTTDSHAIYSSTDNVLLNRSEDVEIGDHVWIAARAVVLKGSRIRDGSVIGMGSVVAGEIPAGVVAVGVPARTKVEGVRWGYEEPPGKCDHFSTAGIPKRI